MSNHTVLIFSPETLSDFARSIGEHFEADYSSNQYEVFALLERKHYRVVIYDAVSSGRLDVKACSALIDSTQIQKTPVVVLGAANRLENKLKAFEIGCDDLISDTITTEEACARVTKAIYHKIAADQLTGRLKQASDMANTALAENSDLGATIRFLLSSHECNNLNELGQSLFATLRRYNLNCSLQMRSIMDIKNMEANGMAKDLESQLLSELKDGDRYIDFGRRTIINYDAASLLIKNMPIEDELKYGSIKDNLFPLVQGVSARIHALENKHRINAERELLSKLSSDLTETMSNIKQSYFSIMNSIVAEVESMSEAISVRLPAFTLGHHDEIFLENTIEHCVMKTNKVFNDGIKLDEYIAKLEASMRLAMDGLDAQATCVKPVEKKHKNDDDIQLF